MVGVVRWLVRELREMAPAFMFFLIAFIVIIVTDALTTEQYGIEPFRVAAAVVGAFVAAKASLLANLLPFMNAFSGRPLIFSTLWRATLYFLAALAVICIEKMIEFAIKYGSVVAAGRHMAVEVMWPRFWAVQIWLFVLFLVFAALQELGLALGNHKLRHLFIGR